MHKRTLLGLVPAAVLAGCGFRLRGVPEFSFSSLYIAASTTSALARELQRTLEGSGSPLKVLRNATDAPADLRERALVLSAALLDMAPGSRAGTGLERARSVLDSGAALAKFLAICEAQGGFREPPRAAFTADVPAAASGRIAEIDNRRLAKLAKLAGAPTSPAAGLETDLRVGDTVERGQPLLTLHAESPGELAYALEHAPALQPFVLREVT